MSKQREPLRCDWPGCRETTTKHWMLAGWSSCCAHSDIEFLPDPAVLCRRHSEMYDELACNPWMTNDAGPAPNRRLDA
jgi:hypothetical protein